MARVAAGRDGRLVQRLDGAAERGGDIERDAADREAVGAVRRQLQLELGVRARHDRHDAARDGGIEAGDQILQALEKSGGNKKEAAELLNLVADGTISGTIAKKVFEIILDTGDGAAAFDDRYSSGTTMDRVSFVIGSNASGGASPRHSDLIRVHPSPGTRPKTPPC